MIGYIRYTYKYMDGTRVRLHLKAYNVQNLFNCFKRTYEVVQKNVYVYLYIKQQNRDFVYNNCMFYCLCDIRKMCGIIKINEVE